MYEYPKRQATPTSGSAHTGYSLCRFFILITVRTPRLFGGGLNINSDLVTKIRCVSIQCKFFYYVHQEAILRLLATAVLTDKHYAPSCSRNAQLLQESGTALGLSHHHVRVFGAAWLERMN